MSVEKLLIRKAIPTDWKRIHEICCKTANTGAPIDLARWPFFGELWTGPYRILLPHWTYVAELRGQIVGYLTGCPHTTRFELLRKLFFIPRLLVLVFFRRYAWNNDSRRFVRRVLKLEKSPEGCFSPMTHQLLKKQYPAHLHINLDASARSLGVGRKLMLRFEEDLKAKNLFQGIHVFCGLSPVPFYEKTGFKLIEMIDFYPSAQAKPVKVFAMGALKVN